MGDINIYLDEAQNLCRQLVADILTEFSLIDLIHHFWKRHHLCHMKTWTQVQQGTVLKARCNYICGTYCRLFEIIGIRDMRNYSSDPLDLQAGLLQHLPQCHTSYLWSRRVFPLYLPTAADLIVADTKYQVLKALDTPPTHPDAPPSPPVDVIDHHKAD